MKTYSSGWYVDEETGESYYLPADTTIRTKEDGKRIREMVAKREEYEAAHQVANTFTTNLCGEFFWSLYDVGQDYHPSISDDLLAKIIYLLTYLDYKKNMLVIRGGASEPYRPMKKEDVRNIIRLHRCKFPRFWESLLGSGIISENDQGELIVCDSFCRGKVDRRSVNGMSKIKMYSRAIRYVYENTDVRSHKYLSYLYRLIPYINLKYNILCLNPLEIDKYKVHPLTTKELCGLIGIAGRKDNEERLTEKLFKLMFFDKNKDKVSVITTIKRIVNDEVCQYITINPQFYAGYISQEDILDIMGEFVIHDKDTLIEMGGESE